MTRKARLMSVSTRGRQAHRKLCSIAMTALRPVGAREAFGSAALIHRARLLTWPRVEWVASGERRRTSIKPGWRQAQLSNFISLARPPFSFAP
jgi:hypothetical protein